MHRNIEHGFGMYLNKWETKQFARAYAKIADGDDGKIDLSVIMDEIFCDLGASVLNKADYALAEVNHLDDQIHDEDLDAICEGLFFYSKRQGSIFGDPLFSVTYKNAAEMAAEFRKEYGQYLPEKFDYKAHLVEFSGLRLY